MNISGNTITASTITLGTIQLGNVTFSFSPTPTANTYIRITNSGAMTAIWGKAPRRSPRCSGCGRWAKLVDTSKMGSPVDCKRCMGEMPRRY
ncbi:hypothetical protein SEA_CECE_54 [Microbacterium phage Cece]|nr:hypothetical protein SEA_CECE_54 [Microbacterium phage Cece]